MGKDQENKSRHKLANFNNCIPRKIQLAWYNEKLIRFGEWRISVSEKLLSFICLSMAGIYASQQDR